MKKKENNTPPNRLAARILCGILAALMVAGSLYWTIQLIF